MIGVIWAWVLAKQDKTCGDLNVLMDVVPDVQEHEDGRYDKDARVIIWGTSNPVAMENLPLRTKRANDLLVDESVAFLGHSAEIATNVFSIRVPEGDPIRPR